MVNEKNQIIGNLNEEISRVKKESLEAQNALSNENEKLQQQFEGKCNELKDESVGKDKLDTLYKELSSEDFSLRNKLSAFEQLISANKDISAKMVTLEKTVTMLTKEKKKLEKELDSAGTKIETVENKCYSTEQKMNQMIQDKDAEISSLINAVKEYKGRLRPYVPVKVQLSCVFYDGLNY